MWLSYNRFLSGSLSIWKQQRSSVDGAVGLQGSAVPSLLYQPCPAAPSEVSWAGRGTVAKAGHSPAIPWPGERAAAGLGPRARPRGWRQPPRRPLPSYSLAAAGAIAEPCTRHCRAASLGTAERRAWTKAMPWHCCSVSPFSCQTSSKGGLKSPGDDQQDRAGMFPFTKAVSLTEPGWFHSGGSSG